MARSWRGRRNLAPMLAVLLLVGTGGGQAATLPASPADYRDQLKRLKPGDELLLAPGRYREGLPLHRIAGTAEAPIRIKGPEGPGRAVFEARAGANTVSIVDSGHLEIANLVLEGNGLDVDAVKAEGHARWAHHITLDNLLIQGYSSRQDAVGISTKCPAWGWVIRNNVIVRAGTGMYLGDSDGGAPFIQGVIEHNLIVDSTGYNLQIKHQRARPDIAGMPSGKGRTIIRHNVFSKAQGGSRETMARPNVLVGHWPPTGPGADDIYLVYGNFFYQNPTGEALFQGEGNIALYANLFVNPWGDAVRIQPHRDVPREVYVFFNTILASGVGIALRGGSPQQRQVIAGNAVFAAAPIAGGLRRGNVALPFEAAGAYLVNPHGQPGELDLYPRPGRLGGRSLDLDFPMSDWPDAARDFNGAPHGGRYRGAYSGEGANPGWLPKLERKPPLREALPPPGEGDSTPQSAGEDVLGR